MTSASTESRSGRALSRPVGGRSAFWIVAYVFAATMLGTTLPTPLYVIYQSRWHFSDGVVTLIFATYAAGVLTALLFAGRSSDLVGRRPVLWTAVALGAASAVVFMLAGAPGWLFLGRILSGFSAGLMTGTATAALTELVPNSNRRTAARVATVANVGGLGLGPLVAGVIAQYGPNPTVLAFACHLLLLAAAAVGLLLVPEPVDRRGRVTIGRPELLVPRAGREAFLAAGAAGFVSFALLGLFSALAPSFLAGVLHEHSHLVAGAVVFLIFGVAALSQLIMIRFPAPVSMLSGLAVLLIALALIVAALSAASLALFLAGTVVAGVAVGSAFVGSLAAANDLAPPAARGQVVSTYFTFAYIGLTLPVIGVGFGSEHLGDFRAVLIAAVVLAVMSVGAAAVIRSRSGTAGPAAG